MVEARWLDREAAAAYLSLRVDELPRMVKRDLVPAPSLHFGPRTPRWDRMALDEMFGPSIAHRRATEIDARFAAIIAAEDTRGANRRRRLAEGR